jgi:YVTN family beta-propeller protein
VTNSVITTVPAGNAPWNIIYNPVNNKIYCANSGSHTISVIDGVTNAVVKTIPVGCVGVGPHTLTYNSTNNKIYCANAGPFPDYADSTVTIIDGVTNNVITTIVVGKGPRAIIYNPTNNKIYTANTGTNDVSVIDGVTNQKIKTIATSVYPRELVYNPQNNKIYVANYYGHSVSVIRDAMSTEIEDHTIMNKRPLTLEVYPNPARDVIRVRIPQTLNQVQGDRMVVKIFDVTGKVIRVEELKSSRVNELRVSLKGLSPGIYFLQLNNELISKKLVITK